MITLTSSSFPFIDVSKYFIGNTFFETGTQNGNTAAVAKEFYFDFVHSTEIKEEYFNFAVERFRSTRHLHFHLGDSPDVLKEHLIIFDKPCTFFLDAHHTGPMMYPYEFLGEAGMSKKYGLSPIMEELEVIKMAKCNTHTIMIDDVKDFDLWSPHFKATDIVNKLYSINKDYKIIYVNACREGKRPGQLLIAYLE